MTVLQMLTEVIGPEELLGLITFAELVDNVQMLGAYIQLRRIWVLYATVAAYISVVGSL